MPHAFPLLLYDSTVKLDPLPFDALDSWKPSRPEESLHRLLTYHTSLGQPLARYIPPEPPRELCWNARYQIRQLLGQGAQGVVYLARREGVDGYYTNVALKIFYRNPRIRAEEYLEELDGRTTTYRRVEDLGRRAPRRPAL